MTDIRTAALKTPVDVAEYLFTRLHQIGVRSVHGVPGDYNLVALDYLDKAGLKWVGNVNELNAGELPSSCTRWKSAFSRILYSNIYALSELCLMIEIYSFID
jgi:pyruvate decarboxylase